jgi:hypothetical protein
LTLKYTKGNLSDKKQLENPENDFILMDAWRTKGLKHIANDVSEEIYDTSKSDSSVIAAPIVSIQGGVIGFVSIRNMPFINFTHEFIALFKTVVQWWGDLLDHHYEVESIKTKNLFDDELGVYRYFFFKTRFDEEVHRCKTFALPMVLTLLEIEHQDQISEDKLSRVMTVLSTTLRELKEPLQELFLFQESGFALITPIQSLNEVIDHFKVGMEKVMQLDLKPYKDALSSLQLKWVHVEFDMTMDTSEAYLSKTKQELLTNAITL